MRLSLRSRGDCHHAHLCAPMYSYIGARSPASSYSLLFSFFARYSAGFSRLLPLRLHCILFCSASTLASALHSPSALPLFCSVSTSAFFLSVHHLYLSHVSYDSNHGVRHRQKSGGANIEYIVYKNYNMWQPWASPGFWFGGTSDKILYIIQFIVSCTALYNHTMYTSVVARISDREGDIQQKFTQQKLLKNFEKFI